MQLSYAYHVHQNMPKIRVRVTDTMCGMIVRLISRLSRLLRVGLPLCIMCGAGVRWILHKWPATKNVPKRTAKCCQEPNHIKFQERETNISKNGTNSNVNMITEKPNATSYLLVISMFALSIIVCEIITYEL